MEVELIWTLAAFLLTLLVFSYVFGDNPIFRLVLYVFIGVAAGYTAVMVIYQVILPRLVWPLFDRTSLERLLVMVPMVLSLLLLTKLSPRLSKLGNVPLAYLAGAGAAIAIGGAVMGTIMTQVGASINLFDMKATSNTQDNPLIRLVEGGIVVVGTITTLIYFHFGAKRNPEQKPYRPIWLEGLAFIGRLFIAVTLGALFAGVYLASLAAMVDRLDFIRSVINQILLIISIQA